MYTEIDKCRICGNKNLTTILNLGEQFLTGVFPLPGESVGKMPVEAVYCDGPYPQCCNLIQLKHTYNLSELYGDNYGYRSGLNSSMVKHLEGIVDEVISLIGAENFKDEDLILDIGSNDSTLLQVYDKLNKKLDLIGIDPTGLKFKEYYPNHITLIPDFFGSEEVTKKLNNKKAKVITSIAMFYDLPDPVGFAREVQKCLDPIYGIWILEQAYTPLTLKTNDLTVFCQEHIEFYSVRQIKWILEKVGMHIVDISFNDSNGGSFRVVAANSFSSRWQNDSKNQLSSILREEENLFNSANTFINFSKNIEVEKQKLLSFLTQCKNDKKLVVGLGASTKFNVMLQYYSITADLLPAIAEVNPYKFGRTTPGTNIPIISEEEGAEMNPDYYLVGPWHFRESMLKRFKKFTSAGGKLIFPLPVLNII